MPARPSRPQTLPYTHPKPVTETNAPPPRLHSSAQLPHGSHTRRRCSFRVPHETTIATYSIERPNLCPLCYLFRAANMYIYFTHCSYHVAPCEVKKQDGPLHPIAGHSPYPYRLWHHRFISRKHLACWTDFWASMSGTDSKSLTRCAKRMGSSRCKNEATCLRSIIV